MKLWKLSTNGRSKTTCFVRNNNKAILLHPIAASILRLMKRARKRSMTWVGQFLFMCQFHHVQFDSHLATNVCQTVNSSDTLTTTTLVRTTCQFERISVQNKCYIEFPFATVFMASADFLWNERLWWQRIVLFSFLLTCSLYISPNRTIHIETFVQITQNFRPPKYMCKIAKKGKWPNLSTR